MSRRTEAPPWWAGRAPLRLLVVEDSPSDRVLIRAMLERSGTLMEICDAGDLAEAIAMLDRAAFDCVLLDLGLPDGEGLPVVEAVLSHGPETAVVVLTGQDHPEVALAAVAAGAQDFLVKGRIDVESLGRTLRHSIERQAITASLTISEGRFRRAFDDAPIGMALSVFGADGSRRVVEVNRSLATILSCTQADLLGRPLMERVHPEDLDDALASLTSLLGDASQPASTECRMQRGDGTWSWVKITSSVLLNLDGSPRQSLAQVEDVNERRKAQEQLADYSFVDALTQLPNRLLALDRIRQALARAARTGRNVAVMYMDVDHFKVVNDSLGHAAGDDLLRIVGARLPEAVRPEDTVARIGGDEFVICCDDLPGEPGAAEVEAVAIADRIRAYLERVVNIDGTDVQITVSIGIVVTGESPRTADELLRDADTALYRAKDNGRSRWEIFDDALRAEAVGRLETERALRHALEQVQLAVLYQPIVEVKTGKVVGAEALLRWQHPSAGLTTPAEFIRVAEETGLIVPIGQWVLEQACATLATWRAEGSELTMAINVSAKQLLRSDLAASVRELCDRHDLKPGSLVIEVTERQLVDLVGSGLTELQRLSDDGVQIALDDFGTGYASLTYLRTLPVDAVKIDQTFVQGMLESATDSAIVESVIRLGTALGLDIVAEGIEELSHADRLRELGCPHAQGWLYGHPLSAERLYVEFPDPVG